MTLLLFKEKCHICQAVFCSVLQKCNIDVTVRYLNLISKKWSCESNLVSVIKILLNYIHLYHTY